MRKVRPKSRRARRSFSNEFPKGLRVSDQVGKRNHVNTETAAHQRKTPYGELKGDSREMHGGILVWLPKQAKDVAGETGETLIKSGV